ncbi:MAG: hypothetical protein ACRD2L_23080, partial [Terriglobia bacterium]
MRFEIFSEIMRIETFAVGSSIREITRLRKRYGKGRWRKMKGVATIQLMKSAKSLPRKFAICVNNADYPVSLELHKLYGLVPDE